MKVGIVGLPNVGKSTLFNALTRNYAADAQNFPFCNKNNTIKLLLSHKHLDQDHADQSGNMMRCLSVNESMYIG